VGYPYFSLPLIGLPCVLLDRDSEAWAKEPLWAVPEYMLFAPHSHMLGFLFLVLGLFSSSIGFHLPDLKVDTDINADSHSEIHDSLVNSTLSNFEFHLNLSSLSFAASLIIIIFLFIFSTRLSRAIAAISVQVLKQKISLDALVKWKVELTK
jgi:hypothetical protein